MSLQIQIPSADSPACMSAQIDLEESNTDSQNNSQILAGSFKQIKLSSVN